MYAPGTMQHATYLKRVHQCAPSSVRQTDRYPYACASGSRFREVQAAKPRLAHSNSREMAAFLVTQSGPRKGQPFPSFRRRARPPTINQMNRSLTPKTPTDNPGPIIHFLWKRMMSQTNTLGKTEGENAKGIYRNPNPKGEPYQQKYVCNI